LPVNLRGVWSRLLAEVAAMLPRGGGSIADAGSVLGPAAAANASAYFAAEQAVVGLTRAPEHLAVTWSRRSAFTERVLRSGKAGPGSGD